MARRQSPSTAVRRDHVATTAIYAGSFDPITRGHEDLIRRSCEFVDHLVVAVAVNSSKKALFTVDERVELIRAATSDNKRIEVTSFEGLLVDFARSDRNLKRGGEAQHVNLDEAVVVSPEPDGNLIAVDEALKTLGGMGQLERLDLSYGRFTAAGFKTLAGMKNLRKLWLDQTRVNNDSMEVLAGLKAGP